MREEGELEKRSLSKDDVESLTMQYWKERFVRLSDLDEMWSEFPWKIIEEKSGIFEGLISVEYDGSISEDGITTISACKHEIVVAKWIKKWRGEKK